MVITRSPSASLPRALYLSSADALNHHYVAFQRCLFGRVPVARWDHTWSFDSQLQGILVVVDEGGAHGTRAMIDASLAAGVKLWHVTTNGLDHVDVAYFREKGMPLAHAAGPQSAVALAEHALAVILYFNKNLDRNRAQSWPTRIPNEELAGKTLGVIGLGDSGLELARRAVFLGMRVMAVDALSISEEARLAVGVTWSGGPDQLSELAPAADFLSLHLPLTAATRQLISRAVRGVMKPTAVIINVSRGGLIDESALIEALQDGRLKGAGLDVYDPEPPAVDNPLLSMSNVVATPHIAGATDETFRRRVQAAAENVIRVSEGLLPFDIVVIGR